LSLDCDARLVNEQLDIDARALIDEIARYLAVVAAFRAENCEPKWRPEAAAAAVCVNAERSAQIEASAH
jgi:hypothetical protein